MEGGMPGPISIVGGEKRRKIVWEPSSAARAVSGGPRRLVCSFGGRYKAGDAVEVALCRGQRRVEASWPKAHDNETYDVDLDGDRPEVGVQIPPEYLRPSVQSRQKAQGNLFAGVHDEASESRRRELRSAVADMLREREALRSRLDALTREKEHLEDVIGVQQTSQNRSGATRAPPIERRASGAARSVFIKRRLRAACAAALPVGTKNEVERAAGFDVVVAALQGEIDGAQCVAALKARLPGAWAATNVKLLGTRTLIVFARSTAVVKDSVKAVAAPKAAVVTATLRSGAKLAFCAVCAGEYDQPLSTDQAVRSARRPLARLDRRCGTTTARLHMWRGPRLPDRRSGLRRFCRW